MDEIKIEHNPDQAKLTDMGVFDWGIWEKEISEFPWEYSEEETCYILEGAIEVTPDGGEPVRIVKGDLATFPKGMKCIWKITEGVRKHFRMG